MVSVTLIVLSEVNTSLEPIVSTAVMVSPATKSAAVGFTLIVNFIFGAESAEYSATAFVTISFGVRSFVVEYSPIDPPSNSPVTVFVKDIFSVVFKGSFILAV